MSQIRVGVLRGGMGDEYDISLKTGAEVLMHLPKETYKPVDIFVDRDGVWHVNGLPREHGEINHMVDVVWNALHGEYGEDGKVQQILEAHGVPYTGSRVQPSAVGMNKILAKETVKKYGVESPYYQTITREEYEGSNPHELFRRVLLPVVGKPLSGGSSLGTFFADNMEDLWAGVLESLEHGDTVILEQYIKGREATVSVVDDLRGMDYYALLPIEIERLPGSKVWGYEEKYNGETVERCPGRFSSSEKKELEQLATLAHQVIGARHYSRSDFIVNKDGIYFLEINTLPGLTSESLMPKALEAIGMSFPQFLDHIIKLALKS
ncbi:MAG: D-alanine--D-alanine ligase [Patescibacteria group bacterium]